MHGDEWRKENAVISSENNDEVRQEVVVKEDVEESEERFHALNPKSCSLNPKNNAKTIRYVNVAVLLIPTVRAARRLADYSLLSVHANVKRDEA